MRIKVSLRANKSDAIQATKDAIITKSKLR